VNILDNVIKNMMRDVAKESIKINDLAMNKTFEVIAKALKTQKGFKQTEREIKTILTGMQTKHMEERKRDVHKIHHQLFVIGNKLVPRVNLVILSNFMILSSQRSR
jgi:phosphoenolpyruvate-protein kinase (PTS system EI component)